MSEQAYNVCRTNTLNGSELGPGGVKRPKNYSPEEVVEEGQKNANAGTWVESSRQTEARTIDGVEVEDTVEITFRREDGEGRMTLRFKKQ